MKVQPLYYGGGKQHREHNGAIKMTNLTDLYSKKPLIIDGDGEGERDAAITAIRNKLRELIDGPSDDLWDALGRAGWQMWDGGNPRQNADEEPKWASYHRDPSGQLFIIEGYPIDESEYEAAGFDKEAVAYYNNELAAAK